MEISSTTLLSKLGAKEIIKVMKNCEIFSADTETEETSLMTTSVCCPKSQYLKESLKEKIQASRK